MCWLTGETVIPQTPLLHPPTFPYHFRTKKKVAYLQGSYRHPTNGAERCLPPTDVQGPARSAASPPQSEYIQHTGTPTAQQWLHDHSFGRIPLVPPTPFAVSFTQTLCTFSSSLSSQPSRPLHNFVWDYFCPKVRTAFLHI